MIIERKVERKKLLKKGKYFRGIFISNLPFDFTEEKLKESFGKFGHI
jgi:RNA recognition motif-containing protein